MKAIQKGKDKIKPKKVTRCIRQMGGQGRKLTSALNSQRTLAHLSHNCINASRLNTEWVQGETRNVTCIAGLYSRKR